MGVEKNAVGIRDREHDNWCNIYSLADGGFVQSLAIQSVADVVIEVLWIRDLHSITCTVLLTYLPTAVTAGLPR